MAFSSGPIGQTDGGAPRPREIPFNYTSADDRQAVSFLLGAETVRTLEELRSARVTGRSARILMRLFGEVLIHRRNPYLFQELVASAPRRKRFFENASKDLEIIASKADGNPRVLNVLAQMPRSDCFVPHRGRGDSRPAQPGETRTGSRGRRPQYSFRSILPGRSRYGCHRLAPSLAAGRGYAGQGRAGGAATAGHRRTRAQSSSARGRHRD